MYPARMRQSCKQRMLKVPQLCLLLAVVSKEPLEGSQEGLLEGGEEEAGELGIKESRRLAHQDR